MLILLAYILIIRERVLRTPALTGRTGKLLNPTQPCVYYNRLNLGRWVERREIMNPKTIVNKRVAIAFKRWELNQAQQRISAVQESHLLEVTEVKILPIAELTRGILCTVKV